MKFLAQVIQDGSGVMRSIWSARVEIDRVAVVAVSTDDAFHVEREG